MTLEQAMLSDTLSELESALAEAEEDYHGALLGWFGSTIPEELVSVSPDEILTMWGVTYPENFRSRDFLRKTILAPLGMS